MKIRGNIRVMNEITFSEAVILEADTATGTIELRVLDKVIELNRSDLAEFLFRTKPQIEEAK